MTAYVIFDVEIHNPERYQDYMTQVKPLVDAAGGIICCVVEITRCMKVTGYRDGWYCLNFLR
jgi:uncharacterized protein (DUF1330 family)